jgi:hypothetical protein
MSNFDQISNLEDTGWIIETGHSRNRIFADERNKRKVVGIYRWKGHKIVVQTSLSSKNIF